MFRVTTQVTLNVGCPAAPRASGTGLCAARHAIGGVLGGDVM